MFLSCQVKLIRFSSFHLIKLFLLNAGNVALYQLDGVRTQLAPKILVLDLHIFQH